MKAQGQIKITISLTPGGTKDIKIAAPTPEARDLALIRLNKCLAALELLESAIQQAETEEMTGQVAIGQQ